MLLVGALAASEVGSVAQIISASEAYRTAGAATTTLEAPGGISGPACNALTGVTGIHGALAIRRARTDVAAVRLPDSTIPTFELSAGFDGFSALPVAADPSGVVISRDLATALDLGVGSVLQLTIGPVTVGGIVDYPDDGRRPGFGYAVFAPSGLTEPFDECWIDTWPQSDQVTGLIYSSLLPNPSSPDTPPRLSQLNSSLGILFPGAAQYDQRISRFAPLAAIIIGAALGALSIRSRRLELASGQHAGVNRITQLAQMLAETSIWAFSGVLLLFACLALARLVGADAIADAARLAIPVILLALPGTLIGATIGAVTTREHHLFRYFKDR